MSWLSLLWAGLFRRRTRTLLTVLSVAAAFLLFACLRGILEGMTAGVDMAGVDRLITSPRYSIIDPLPISHLDRIRAVAGVEAVTHANWFGGNYQGPQNFFAKFPVDPQGWFDLYPEYRVAPDQLAAFARTRTGALAPAAMAARFGWKVGDRIPIEADIWPQKGGARLWTFDLVGTYAPAGDRDPSPDTFLINHAYFDEARQAGEGTVGWFIVRIADPARAAEVASAIDAAFANSAYETRTATEQEFQLQFVKQLGDIGLIVSGILGAVFFTILLLTGNTMAQAFRERIPELAVLKTLGFANGTVLALVLGEAVLLCALGAGAGLAAAALLAPVLADALQGVFPGFGLGWRTVAAGLGIAVGLGVATGIGPALSAARLTIVEALRRG
jgi:putative ABC transport system permease protein